MRCLQGCLAHLEQKIIIAALALATALLFGSPANGNAQTFTTIHEFTGGFDGGIPMAGLTPDAAGNLYGTTENGGTLHCANGCGTVFKLSRRNGSWVLTTLYSFQGYLDGSNPIGRVIFGPDGALYGTASSTGQCDICGVVFKLTPPPTPCGSLSCMWVETILHKFVQNGVDGYNPTGDLVFDRAGNIYGTTPVGGVNRQGTVYELTPTNGSWTETILYSFSGPDGSEPTSGVVFDSAGNLYGTTLYGGDLGYGVIFQLSQSGSGWTETVRHSFTDMSPDGSHPYAGLTPDGTGSFYGTTGFGGTGQCFGGRGKVGCGTVFHGFGSGTVYSFSARNIINQPDGPNSPVTLDAQGNLYGTTYSNAANGYGSVYMLTAQFAYTSLHDFTNGDDGSYPVGSVVRDSSGNLFGTTSEGGANLRGVVWEITP